MSTSEPGRGAVRPVFYLALLVADVGAAVPFGLETAPGSPHIAAIEWAHSAVFAAASLVLIARLVGLLRHRWGAAAVAVSAGAWAATAFYHGFLLPGATWRERAGLGLIFAGYAFAAAFAYAIDWEHSR